MFLIYYTQDTFFADDEALVKHVSYEWRIWETQINTKCCFEFLNIKMFHQVPRVEIIKINSFLW